MAVLISIFLLSLINAHWANKLHFSFNSKTLSCTFNFNGLLDQVNVLTEDLFIGSKILFSLSGCILSLTNSSKRLLSNCLTVMRLSNISLEYNCPVTGPPQALSYWGGNISQNRAPLKAFEATSSRKRSRLQYTR